MGVGDLPVPPPVSPMLATLARELPHGDRCYEPKWDGFRCIAFREGGDTLLTSRNQRPLDRYFPEIVEGLLDAGDTTRFVLDGEIVAAGDGGPDFSALMMRLHPSPSRVARLRRETPASFVAFDLLAVGDLDVRSAPFGERRRRLSDLVGDGPAATALTPATDDPSVAEGWLQGSGGGGIDGVVAKEVQSPYEAGRRSKAWLKVKPERTADCVVGGFRTLEEQPLVASLLLGLYDHDGQLRHVGVAASFSAAQRLQLARQLAPHAPSLSVHTW